MIFYLRLLHNDYYERFGGHTAPPDAIDPLKFNNKDEYYRDRMTKIKERYQKIRTDYIFEYDQFLVNQAESCLPEGIPEFVKDVLYEYMPFGILNLNVIYEAKEHLEYQNQFPQFSDQSPQFWEWFYGMIPKKFTPDNVPAKLVMLDRIESTVKALNVGRNRPENVLDYIYNHYLLTKFDPLNKESDEFNEIEKLITDSNKTVSGSYGDSYKIKNIFKVTECEANKNFVSKSDNQELFHSTYGNLMLDILQEGLRKGTDLFHVGQVEGCNKRDGDGIYFSRKPYMHKFSRFGRTAFILRCTVTSPKMYDENQGHYTAENSNQVKINYIIELQQS